MMHRRRPRSCRPRSEAERAGFGTRRRRWVANCSKIAVSLFSKQQNNEICSLLSSPGWTRTNNLRLTADALPIELPGIAGAASVAAPARLRPRPRIGTTVVDGCCPRGRLVGRGRSPRRRVELGRPRAAVRPPGEAVIVSWDEPAGRAASRWMVASNAIAIPATRSGSSPSVARRRRDEDQRRESGRRSRRASTGSLAARLARRCVRREPRQRVDDLPARLAGAGRALVKPGRRESCPRPRAGAARAADAVSGGGPASSAPTAAVARPMCGTREHGTSRRPRRSTPSRPRRRPRSTSRPDASSRRGGARSRPPRRRRVRSRRAAPSSTLSVPLPEAVSILWGEPVRRGAAGCRRRARRCRAGPAICRVGLEGRAERQRPAEVAPAWSTLTGTTTSSARSSATSQRCRHRRAGRQKPPADPDVVRGSPCSAVTARRPPCSWPPDSRRPRPSLCVPRFA